MEGRDAATSASSVAEPLLPLGSPARSGGSLGGLLGRRSGRPARVREAAVAELEGRRADLAYSPPVVALDVAWNLAFVVAAAAVLASTACERPVAPLRLWLAGYALQCVIHVALVCAEYRRRSSRPRRGVAAVPEEEESGVEESGGEGPGASRRGGYRFLYKYDANLTAIFYVFLLIIGHVVPSIAKRCEYVNTVISVGWWIVGFYWVVSGGQALLQYAPRLYWLTVIFLSFDVFFAIFCVALACVIGFALCCCLPCIIALLYALAGQDGASDADISMLPRYRYVEPSDNGQKTSAEGLMIPILSNNGTSSSERVLLCEDAECCICLGSYADQTEIIPLTCQHHFHSLCIIKWLRINAVCPLCKFNILKGNDAV